MRVLLDECLPRKLKRYLPGHECETVRQAGFVGKSNGELLDAAEAASFDVLLTVDKGLPQQQNFRNRRLSVINIRAISNSIRDLAPNIPACLAALERVRAGEVLVVGELRGRKSREQR